MPVHRGEGLFDKVFIAWGFTAFLLIVAATVGISPARDGDDILRLHQIRSLLNHGMWFNLTLPGIAMPGEYVSPWSRLVDAPYTVLAFLLGPVLGRETALQFPTWMVPLLWLGLTFTALQKIWKKLFQPIWPIWFVVLLSGFYGLFQFAPGRIDHHQVQIALVALVMMLLSGRTEISFFLAGQVMAFSAAVGFEAIPFHLAAFAILVFNDIANRFNSRNVGGFGIGMIVGAILVTMTTVAPDTWTEYTCDSWSAFSIVAYGMTGLGFLVMSMRTHRQNRLFIRLGLWGMLALIVAGVLWVIFPDCHSGPYPWLSPWLKEIWLGGILQELSILEQPVLITSSLTLLFFFLPLSGAFILVEWAIHDRARNPTILIVATMAFTVSAATILFFRYVYYLPLIGAPGIVIFFAHWLRREGWTKEVSTKRLPRFFGLPSLGLVVALYALCFAWQTGEIGKSHASSWQTPAARYAGLCTPKLEALRFKLQSRIITPPLLGINILGTKNVTVTAIPFHRAAQGMETAYQLFDGDNALKDLLSTAGAKLVASCAFDKKSLTIPKKLNPRGYALLTGTPPDGLARCPLPDGTGIFLYHDERVQENLVCPANRKI